MAFFMLAITLFSNTANAEIECFGPKWANRGAIYFHGHDWPFYQRYEDGEELNRSTIKKIAEDLKLRLALPLGKRSV